MATCVVAANQHDGQTALAWWVLLAHHPLLGRVKRVELSISWITNNRRFARCYERNVRNEESFILLRNIRRIIQKR